MAENMLLWERHLTSRSEKNIVDVRSDVRGKHRITMHELSEDVQISHDSIHPIISEDFGMKRVSSAKFVAQTFS